LQFSGGKKSEKTFKTARKQGWGFCVDIIANFGGLIIMIKATRYTDF